MKVLDNSIPVSKVHTAELFDAVYVPGGHGCCFDMPESKELQAILAKAYEAGKVVASVCHGPTCFVNVCLTDGTKLVKGKKVCFLSICCVCQNSAIRFRKHQCVIAMILRIFRACLDKLLSCAGHWLYQL